MEFLLKMKLDRLFSCCYFFIPLFILLISGNVFSENTIDLSAHLKFKSTYVEYKADSLATQFGPESGFLNDYNFRPQLKYFFSDFKFQADLEVNGIGGSSKPAVEGVLFGRPLLENDDRRIINLSTAEGDDSFTRTTRFDRLLVAYATPDSSISIGRQSFSYGNGLVFSVQDVFNPFSPIAYDTEFKIGEDMAVIRKELSSTLSATILLLGRRDEQSSIRATESSFASMLRYSKDSLELNLMAAEHFGNARYGLGGTYQYAGSIFRTDISYYHTDIGKERVDFLCNVDRGFDILGYNIYAFAEYFYSGQGLSSFDSPNPEPEIVDRLRRGELFTFGRQYSAIGLRADVTERSSLTNAVIFNLIDMSSIYRPFLEYDISDYSRIRFGAAFFFGGEDSEFGGFSLNDLPQRFVPGNQVFLQYSYYF